MLHFQRGHRHSKAEGFAYKSRKWKKKSSYLTTVNRQGACVTFFSCRLFPRVMQTLVPQVPILWVLGIQILKMGRGL